MKRNRLMLAQLALFVVISIACTWSVASDVLGPRMFRQPDLVTVRMPDSGGINPDSQVTYRGVKVGSVAGSRLDPNGGVNLTLSLDPGARIPASARAVVSMDTPLALQHLDVAHQQRIRNQHAMALPPARFGAHYRDAPPRDRNRAVYRSPR